MGAAVFVWCWTTPERSRGAARGGLAGVWLPFVFRLVLSWQRDGWWCNRLKSLQNSPIYFLKPLTLSWSPGWVCCAGLAVPWCAQRWAALCSQHRCLSLSGTGTNLGRSWRLTLELQSSWLLKWWTTTLSPSQQTCGVWASSPTCCEYPGGWWCRSRGTRSRNVATTQPLWLGLLLIHSAKNPKSL